MEYSIDIQGLEKSFGSKFKLGPLDLHVPTGSIYGLIGPNGAGKTTTIDLCMNMGKEEAGAIYIFGKHHRNEVVAVKQEIGYVSPDLNFDAWGKIHRLLRYYRKFYPEWDDAYCSELLGKLERNRRTESRRFPLAEKSNSDWSSRCRIAQSCCCSTSRPSDSTRFPNSKSSASCWRP